MEVILLQRVAKLGQMGEVVRVKDGFARNFLLPQGKALRATKDNRSKFEGMKAQLEASNLELKKDADVVAAKLNGQSFIVVRQASDVGQLFGSVSARDIAALGDRGRLHGSAQPDPAAAADQDHRPAHRAGGAASGSRGDDHDQRRAQCRRGRASGARRERDAAPRGDGRTSRQRPRPRRSSRSPKKQPSIRARARKRKPTE